MSVRSFLTSQELTGTVNLNLNEELSYANRRAVEVYLQVLLLEPNAIAGGVSRRSAVLVCEPSSQMAAVISGVAFVCTTVPLKKALE